ncbi:phytoene desaturase family protein [Paenalcaligenes sp. Me52]|uniref:phytoene desaturase family protein n=1 Tax=Paenalcaligenes sp. Me52 TaxID=3392038 RepID=UPI003D290375
MPQHQDVVVVGSGINSLCCAALLACRGLTVTVLERNPVAGGCIRTEELFPGFTHDVFSSWYPLFVGGAAYAELAQPLADAGLRFVSGDYSTGLATPHGTGIALRQDMEDTVQRLNAIAPGDGDAIGQAAAQIFGNDAALVFGLMGNDPYSWKTSKLLFSSWRQRGLDGMLHFASDSLENFRRWAEYALQNDLSRALIAPWVLHSGLGPDEAASSLIGKLTFAAVVAGGMPVVEGGSYKLVEAFIRVIEERGGHVLTGQHVDEVLIKNGKAIGVRTATQERFMASKAVVCNVTPNQLYEKLLPTAGPEYQQLAKRYRYGRGGMQIHFALKERPHWLNPELIHVPMVHVTESMEQVCASVVEANNGWLPAKPTLAVGQPLAVDPSRAPEGSWILWVQMQDMPSTVKADVANELPIPADGRWNDALRDGMVERVRQRLETVMPGFSQHIIGSKAYSPADLEAWNMNLVGGDPYSGVCSPDQFFFMRPFAGNAKTRTGRTPIPNLFQIGASVHPGPGLGGQSGYLTAQRICNK